MKRLSILVVAALLCSLAAFAQTETATISGRVTDPTGAVISGADVRVENVMTGREIEAKTTPGGLYVVAGLPPGTYRVIVSNAGFKQIVKPNIVLNVQDNISLNFNMTIGSAAETVTVEGGAPIVNTQDTSVSTVVDRQFVENMPMNGRSFQSLIAQAPGAVIVPGDFEEPGQFSFNGQRATSNYFMVDGVSANIAMSAFAGTNQSSAGTTAGFNALGGTNGLVSIDAMQEFRIQTSTFAPEFGRVPGAQISIATRSGTNVFHGTLFDYFRNDVLDANDWFSKRDKLPRAAERQNDFGGVFGGPIWKDRTFFFLSYEGLRLRLPNTVEALVPGTNARATAPAAIQPFLAVFPKPTGPDNPDNSAPFVGNFSDPATIDAISLRVDQVVNSKITLFGRYNWSPSKVSSRGEGSDTPSEVDTSRSTIQTLTGAMTWTPAPRLLNDLRFNYSRNATGTVLGNDTFGGAALPPPDSQLYPSPFTHQNAQFFLSIFSLTPHVGWGAGHDASNLQRQYNIVDSLSWQKGAHNLKFGADYRRLSPQGRPTAYSQQVAFLDVNSALALQPFFAFVIDEVPNNIEYQNLGMFAQDTWRATHRLTLTYGLRWDVDFAPHAASGPDLIAVNQVTDPANIAVAPTGTPVFHTRFSNFAPRVGAAYELSSRANWNTVLRGGFGMFYDLSSQEISQALTLVYPYGAGTFALFPGSFPLPPSVAAPPPIVNSFTGNELIAADPNLNLPYSLQWNLAVEQGLGANQVLTATYVGQAGRRLIQTQFDFPVNANILFAQFYRNRATSDYHALQLQFQRRLSHGLQVLAGYTFSHSIDTASSNNGELAASFGSLFTPTLKSRSSSDFDIRQTFTAAVTYDFPTPGRDRLVRALGRGWSVDSLVQARTAPPVDVFSTGIVGGFESEVRPNVVSGQPMFIFGANCATIEQGLGNLQPGQSCPGGKAINPNAFTDPAFGTQGNLGRNALRGFGASQWDLAIRRQFKIKEGLNLQFRAEFFNALNHPNFAPPVNMFSQAFPTPQFGLSTQTLARNLSGGSFGTGFSPLYSLGGPRSVQLALKLQF